MFRNLFFAAILAALCAGLLTSVLQQVRLTPLILAAETYETTGGHEHTHAEGEAVAPHTHEEDEWMPADGVERTAYTVLANLLLGAGFAFVMAAVSLVFSLPITPGTGLLWGLGGFAAFSLAPALGLPPGLPGMPIAETGARQLWWAFAAVSTGAGFVLIAKLRTWWAAVMAIALIALPHLVGAPQPPIEETGVPAGLAAAFVSAVLFNAAAFWVALGLAYGYFNQRISGGAQ
ncbi:CbtA family protein [Pelagibacterium xiamenense]|uniref:CbtA family protein n=1 Tax=Pelagibacterium xiamenense TaxID=2901140 RepID=UPI001E30ACAA|nr:CbtA family protein [Pelagibacterium xiamenense]MCD7058801.1 CbtA family protein [Pelagibacterium xiamenense]